MLSLNRVPGHPGFRYVVRDGAVIGAVRVKRAGRIVGIGHRQGPGMRANGSLRFCLRMMGA